MKPLNLEVSFQDNRGKIIDLIENESIDAVTIVTFNQGAIRGNHYHKETIQYNYLISGKLKLVTQTDNGPIHETIMEKGSFTISHPYEKHAFYAIEDAELMVFTRGPRGGKNYESDTFRLDTPLIFSEN